jgi:dUTP pyrophosphatase
MNVYVKFLPNVDQEKNLPSYATKGSAGADLRSNESIIIPPGEWRLIKTGFCVEVPSGFEAQIRARSGLALKYGVTVLNGVGVLDSDYRGEVGVILINHGKQPFSISPGDRIAQMVISQVFNVNFVPVDDLTDTDRDVGGWGSTGVK